MHDLALLSIRRARSVRSRSQTWTEVLCICRRWQVRRALHPSRISAHTVFCTVFCSAILNYCNVSRCSRYVMWVTRRANFGGAPNSQMHRHESGKQIDESDVPTPKHHSRRAAGVRSELRTPGGAEGQMRSWQSASNESEYPARAISPGIVTKGNSHSGTTESEYAQR